MAVDREFHNHLVGELLALNTLLLNLTKVVGHMTGDRKKFCEQLLESGLTAMANTNLWSTPVEDREGVLEGARARFSEMMADAAR